MFEFEGILYNTILYYAIWLPTHLVIQLIAIETQTHTQTHYTDIDETNCIKFCHDSIVLEVESKGDVVNVRLHLFMNIVSNLCCFSTLSQATTILLSLCANRFKLMSTNQLCHCFVSTSNVAPKKKLIDIVDYHTLCSIHFMVIFSLS